MTKEEIERLYNELDWKKINDLYFYSCLLTSDFDKDKAYDYIDKLKYVYYKDVNNCSIAQLSDMLYYVDKHYDIKNIPGIELLLLMYKHEYDCDNED